MGKGNFLQDLIQSIFGSSDPEAIKKRNLKNINKALIKTKYHFYKMQSHEVDPSLAKYFYDIYKAIAPAQTMMQQMNPNMLKKMVIDYAMSEAQREAVDKLDEQSINELARKLSVKELTEQVNKIFETATGEFDSSKIARIDSLYTKLVAFSAFCTYDYYFFLKKFDSAMVEKSFTAVPRFQSINGSYVAEDLRNFTDVAWSIPFDAEWDDLFKMFKTLKGTEPVSPNVWKKVLARIRTLRDRHITEMLVQLITEDPSYREEITIKDLYIADDYISNLKKQCTKILDDIKAKQTAGKVDSLLSEVFGTTDVEKLKFYTSAGSAPFERKDLGSFEYTDPLAYLKQFLLNYTKKEIRELSDILLVRGEWANQQLAKPMSDAFHQLCEIADQIIKLDNSLDETADLGLKMKTHLPSTERNKDARNIIQTTLMDVNDAAGTMILTAIKLFVSYDRNLKMILEDSAKQHPELLINWKEIDHFAEGNLKQMCIDTYKKIYNFVQLLQNFPVELSDR